MQKNSFQQQKISVHCKYMKNIFQLIKSMNILISFSEQNRCLVDLRNIEDVKCLGLYIYILKFSEKPVFRKIHVKARILKSPRFASCGFTQVFISQNLQNFIMTYYFSYITDKSKNQRMLIIPYSLIVKISFLTGKNLFMFMISFFQIM